MAWRRAQIYRRYSKAEETQLKALKRLVNKAANTYYGQNFGFNTIKTYEDFALRVPLSDYETVKADIDRMRHGEKDVLWPGRVKW